MINTRDITFLPDSVVLADSEKNVTIQSFAGDSEKRRNEGANGPEMSRLGAKGGGSPFC
jgi:hypothetical protein